MVSKRVMFFGLLVFWTCGNMFLLMHYLNKESLIPNGCPVCALEPDSLQYVPEYISLSIDNLICEDTQMFDVIWLVMSHAGNVDRRLALRRAISISDLQKLSVRRVFLLAVPDPHVGDPYTIPYNNDVPRSRILAEHRDFDDLLQGNFVESYRNLTLKHIMGLRWVVDRCRRVKYIIKTDDDWTIDIYRLLALIKSQSSNLDASKVIMGFQFQASTPYREHFYKGYVSYKEYPRKLYPNYVTGCVYVTTRTVAKALLSFTNAVPYLVIEDVYVTGLLAELANVKHEPMCWENLGYYPNSRDCVTGENYKKRNCIFIGTEHIGEAKLIRELEEHFRYCFYNNCETLKQSNCTMFRTY